MNTTDKSPQKANWVAAIVFLVALAVFYSVREQRLIRQSVMYDVITGRTMGTVYEIKLAYTGMGEEALDELRNAVQSELDSVEQKMSLYIKDSEISRFNRAPADEWLEASESLVYVVEESLKYAELTLGSFDPTIAPLVNLWGFGRYEPRRDPPPAEAIEVALSLVGHDKVTAQAGRGLRKTAAEIEVDLGGIAKGYGVDRVALLLRERGVKDFMVEIGGDIYVSGLNSAEDLWRIGIDAPKLSAIPGNQLHGIVNVSNIAIATSGGYRNFIRTDDGTIYSHIIDPRTGHPVPAYSASITVIADNCLTADALATALYVLGEDEGLEVIEGLDGVEAMFIIMEDEERFRESASSGFYERTYYLRAAR